MNKCVKNGCNNLQATGKQLCEKHTAEWDKIWDKSRNAEWENYIHDKGKETVQFT